MYFSEERRLAILRRFYDALEPGGYFLLGHAETLDEHTREIRAGGPWAIAGFIASRVRLRRVARQLWWRERCERAQSRINRAVPAGGFRKPPVSAGVLRAFAGVADQAEDLEKLYIASHTLAGTSGELRLSRIFRSRRENGAHLSLRHERDTNSRHARPAHGISLGRDFRARIRPAANQLERNGNVRRHRGVQAALRIRVSRSSTCRNGIRIDAAESSWALANHSGVFPGRFVRRPLAAGWRSSRRSARVFYSRGRGTFAGGHRMPAGA